MALVLALLLCLLLPNAAHATTVSDNFNRADGALTAPWTTFGSMGVVSTTAQATSIAAASRATRARYDTALASQNHYVQGTLAFSAVGTNAGGILLARMNASTDDAVSLWVYTQNGGTTYKMGFYTFSDGYATVALGSELDVTASITTSNVIRMDIAGAAPNTLLVGSIDGVPKIVLSGITTVDGNVRAGIATWESTTQVSWDDFSASDLAPTGQPPDCQQMSVMAAIDQAADGDTITIPAGQCTIANGTAWRASASVSKRLKIQGAGIDTTTIQDNRDQAAVDFPRFEAKQILTWNVPSTGLSTMSGITWQGYGGSRSSPFGPQLGMLSFTGDGSHKLFRLHHMKFVPRGTANAAAGFITSGLFGVVDHITCDLLVGQAPCHYTYLDSYQGIGASGDNSWATASTMGTDQAMYFEDNQYLAVASAFFQFAADSLGGARVVYRHNTVRNTDIASHGTDSDGRLRRGVRHSEIYNNQFYIDAGNTGLTFATGLRGGTGVLFENTITVDPAGTLSGLGDLSVFRTQLNRSDATYSDFARCGQTSVSLTSSGTTATATSNTSAVLGSPTSQGGTLYVKITGATVSGYNGTWPVVDSTGASIRFTTTGSGLASSSGTFMSPWDGNTDSLGYPCLDQIGRGRGDLWSGTDPAGGNPANAVWPNQASEPVYGWHNTLNGADSPLVEASADASGIAQEDRDFFNCTIGSPKTGCLTGTVGSPPGSPTPKAGYTPFTYPHPLTVETSTTHKHWIFRHRP